MKKLWKILFSILVMLTLLSGCEDDMETSFADLPPSDGESFTLMVYLLGSDLESDGGCASSDLDEMMAAYLGDSVNVVVQTGGASAWENPAIDGDSCQRFSIENNQLVEQADLGLIRMLTPSAVADFIQWSTQNFPADRYGIVFWDHGGGTLMGYGLDEHFPDDELLLEDIAAALDAGGTHMDFIGFDACLMGTIETAYALSPYGDFLIASEETEPGTGWYYTDWLSALGEDPSMNTITLGSHIVDDFVNGPDASFFWDDLTLSVIDLREIPALYDVLLDYMANSRVKLQDYGYQDLAEARYEAKDYGESDYEQIDIANYIELADVDGGEDVLKALEAAIAYSDNNIWDSCGLSMYYPYYYPEYYTTALEQLERIGIHEDYYSYFSDFVSVMTSGQVSASSYSPFDSSASSGDDYSSEDWFQEDLGEAYEDLFAEQAAFSTTELSLEEKEDYFVLQLSDEEWGNIASIEQFVYIDDGEGYLGLGWDNVYTFDEDENELLVDFDYTWVCLDGQVVPFYAVEEGIRPTGSWYSYGYSTATLNDEQDIEIMIFWDEDHPEGYVAGYRPVQTDAFPYRNLMQLQEGDVLDFYCDFYTYDEEYEDTYYIGDSLICGDELTVSYEDIGEETVLFYVRLTDFFQNEYWTEPLTFYF